MASLRVAHLATNPWPTAGLRGKAPPVPPVASGRPRFNDVVLRSSYDVINASTGYENSRASGVWDSLEKIALVWSCFGDVSSRALPPETSTEFDTSNVQHKYKSNCDIGPSVPGFPCFWLRRAMWSSWPGWWVQSWVFHTAQCRWWKKIVKYVSCCETMLNILYPLWRRSHWAQLHRHWTFLDHAVVVRTPAGRLDSFPMCRQNLRFTITRRCELASGIMNFSKWLVYSSDPTNLYVKGLKLSHLDAIIGFHVEVFVYVSLLCVQQVLCDRPCPGSSSTTSHCQSGAPRCAVCPLGFTRQNRIPCQNPDLIPFPQFNPDISRIYPDVFRDLGPKNYGPQGLPWHLAGCTSYRDSGQTAGPYNIARIFVEGPCESQDDVDMAWYIYIYDIHAVCM